MNKEQITAKMLAALTEEERGELLVWAREAKLIQENKSLSLTQRFGELQRLKTSPFIISVLKRLFRELKIKAWDERSWPVRMGVSGLAIGSATFGGQSIGIAGFGTAIGVSLALLGGVGGSILGLIISHLENERNKKS